MAAEQPHYRELLASFVLPYWRRTFLLAVLLFSAIGLQLVSPLILRRFIDLAVGRSALGDTTAIALAYTLVALLSQLVGIAEAYVAADVAWRATNKLRATVARHCLRQDMSFHHKHLPGEFIERIDGDTSTLANFFSRFVVSILELVYCIPIVVAYPVFSRVEGSVARLEGTMQAVIGYQTDLTDEQWAYIEGFVAPEQSQFGPKIRVSRRAIVDAIVYLTRTGCQWRLLPHDFPNWHTVRHYFDTWRRDGTWDLINAALIELVRLKAKRAATPSVLIIDSQSVKTTEMGGEVGFDGGKNNQGAEAPARGGFDGQSARGRGACGEYRGLCGG